jgi:hypothetical protein
MKDSASNRDYIICLRALPVSSRCAIYCAFRRLGRSSDIEQFPKRCANTHNLFRTIPFIMEEPIVGKPVLWRNNRYLAGWVVMYSKRH